MTNLDLFTDIGTSKVSALYDRYEASQAGSDQVKAKPFATRLKHQPDDQLSHICTYVHELVLVIYDLIEMPDCGIADCGIANCGIAGCKIQQNKQLRQLAIYICRVSFGVSFGKLSVIFQLNKSTVYYACSKIEDKREQPEFDVFLSFIEKLVLKLAPLLAK